MKKKKKWKWIMIILLIIAIVAGGITLAVMKVRETVKTVLEGVEETSIVERGDLEEKLSSSGMLAPLDSYKVTAASNIEGTILTADFEEGDQVKKGDILYRVGSDALDTKISSARRNVTRAEEKVSKAKKDYNKVLGECSDYTVKATASGYVKEVPVKKGTTLAQGVTVVASVYNNTYMTIILPFNAASVSSKMVGKTAEVTLSDTDETLNGTVTKVTNYTDTLSGNRTVKYVTIRVKNDGGLSESQAATASIGNVDCNEEGYFQKAQDHTVVSDLNGIVSRVLVKEGQWVEKGDALVKIEDGTYDKAIEESKEQVETAQDSLEDAKEALKELSDSKSDYVITSPITGTIVKKNGKEGDKVSALTDGLCTIYDLSNMTLEMMIDELDIRKVEKGQNVTLTADAMEGVTYEGIVTSICLEGKRNGNMTQYPVMVRIADTGDLLPGMSVEASILVQESKDTLIVPSECLMRDNIVYVKDDSVKEPDGEVPAGYRAVEVKIGISDGTSIEILDGLKEGDEVYRPAIQSSGDYMGMDDGVNVEYEDTETEDTTQAGDDYGTDTE
ncbi:MAG: HlyD family efflux transporter periplasmic adaptor subunit [Clostridiales bacterium]|nr:HlyD family efflux transporter periplasmic adaptor subunit [Clostridiales bacterium]